MNININKFLERFSENYIFIYENHDNIAGFNEALALGDKFIKEHSDFINEFNKFRGDILSSDREVVAFMFTLDDMSN